jgi:putative nucleotidyltransferase with HDIG domain
MTSWVLSRLIHRPHGVALLLWWLGIAVISTLVLVGVDRIARRLVPLAVLLRLSMAFPDQAPSRFKVAARAGTTRRLQEQLREAENARDDEQPMHAAQRILALVAALGAHDRRTRGHSERVRAFNDLIAEEMRLPQSDRDRLRWAALLHDIGKLHVSHRILNKPSKPTEKEWAILKSHPSRGARITAPLAEWLGPWAASIEQHHERWDGRGYPNGLRENEITLGGRIVAVADAYEVMTAPRPYQRPVSAEAARQELARCAGGQFDPEVVRAFLSVSLGSLRRVIGPISWLAQLPILGSAPKLEATVGAAGRQFVTAAATATGGGVIAVGALAPAPHIPIHAHETAVQLQEQGRSPASAPRSGQAPAAATPAMTAAPRDSNSRPTPMQTTDSPKATKSPSRNAAPGKTAKAPPAGADSAGSTEPPGSAPGVDAPVVNDPPTTTPTSTSTSTSTSTPPSSGSATLHGVVSGPLVVAAGQTITLQDATVTGSVTVEKGGGLVVVDSTIQGPLASSGATTLDICGSNIFGSLTVDETSAPVRVGDAASSGCAGNAIHGSVFLTHNRHGVRLYDNAISGSMRLTENRGGAGVIVAGNVVSGSLDGTGNQDVGNDGVPNIAQSKSGDFRRM